MKISKKVLALAIGAVVVIGGIAYYGPSTGLQGFMSKESFKNKNSQELQQKRPAPYSVSISPKSPSGYRALVFGDTVASFEITADQELEFSKVKFMFHGNESLDSRITVDDLGMSLEVDGRDIPGQVYLSVGNSSKIKAIYQFDQPYRLLEGQTVRLDLQVNTPELMISRSGIDDLLTTELYGLFNDADEVKSTSNTLSY